MYNRGTVLLEMQDVKVQLDLKSRSIEQCASIGFSRLNLPHVIYDLTFRSVRMLGSFIDSISWIHPSRSKSNLSINFALSRRCRSAPSLRCRKLEMLPHCILFTEPYAWSIFSKQKFMMYSRSTRKLLANLILSTAADYYMRISRNGCSSLYYLISLLIQYSVSNIRLLSPV